MKPGFMDGILLVDKPAGISSAGVVASVKRLLKAGKAGHTGTLDPFATGLLVCCIDKATRLAGILESLTKVYEGVLRLGVRTDTQDATGKVLSEVATPALTRSGVESVCARFVGSGKQIPPIFSALKHKGIPLYKLARSGRGIRKPARQITIYWLEILEMDLPEVYFRVCCSKGTYIRALASDIGDALGCGGHLADLRRLACGRFSIEDAVTLDEIAALSETDSVGSRIISMKDSLSETPELAVDDKTAAEVLSGQLLARRLLAPFERNGSSWLKVVNSQERLIAVMRRVEKDGCYRYHAVFPRGNGTCHGFNDSTLRQTANKKIEFDNQKEE